MPRISVLLDQGLEYAPAATPIERELRVYLQSVDTMPHSVKLEARLPAGLATDSAIREVTVPRGGAVLTATIRVRGRLPVGNM